MFVLFVYNDLVGGSYWWINTPTAGAPQEGGAHAVWSWWAVACDLLITPNIPSMYSQPVLLPRYLVTYYNLKYSTPHLTSCLFSSLSSKPWAPCPAACRCGAFCAQDRSDGRPLSTSAHTTPFCPRGVPHTEKPDAANGGWATTFPLQLTTKTTPGAAHIRHM